MTPLTSHDTPILDAFTKTAVRTIELLRPDVTDRPAVSIKSAFVWSQAPHGYNFWQAVNDRKSVNETLDELDMTFVDSLGNELPQQYQRQALTNVKNYFRRVGNFYWDNYPHPLDNETFNKGKMHLKDAFSWSASTEGFEFWYELTKGRVPEQPNGYDVSVDISEPDEVAHTCPYLAVTEDGTPVIVVDETELMADLVDLNTGERFALGHRGYARLKGSITLTQDA